MADTPYCELPGERSEPERNPLDWEIGDAAFGFYSVSEKFPGGSAIVYGLMHRGVAEPQFSLDVESGTVRQTGVIIDSHMLYAIGEASRVAAKVPRRELINDPHIRRRFAEECLVWARVGRHPHIVRAYRVSYIGDVPVLLMEFLPFGSLQSVVKSAAEGSPPSLERTLTWALDFCQGMKAAALAGLLSHGDVSPSNLLLDLEQRLKICDFGLAWMKDVCGPSPLAGPRVYRAPEHGAGKACDLRSDIYSFGVVLYELLGGRRPVRPDRQALLPVERVAGDAALVEVLARCLDADPGRRYQRIEELEHDLTGIHERVVGRRYTVRSHRDTFSDAVGEARMLLAVDLPKDAMERLESADLVDSALPEIHKLKGLCLHALEDYRAAIEEFGKYKQELGHRVGGENGFPLWATTEGHYAEADYLRAFSLAKSGQLDESLEICGQALRVDPSFAPAWKLRSGCLALLARFRPTHPSRTKWLREAIESAEKALELAPAAAETIVNKGFAHSLLEDFEQAKAAAKRALDMDPKFAPAWFLWGESSRCLGCFDDAIRGFEQAAALAPTLPRRHEAILEKARLLLLAGNLADVQEICDDVERQGGHGPDLDYVRGILYVNLARPAEALQALQRAKTAYPEDPLLLANMANVLCMMGQHKAALTYANRALEVSPDSVPALNAKFAATLALWSPASPPNAREVLDVQRDLDRLVSLAPNSSVAHRNRAIFLRLTCNDTEALHAIEKAIRLDPDDPIPRDLKDEWEAETTLRRRPIELKLQKRQL